MTTVLLVDDDRSVRQALERMLLTAGYVVIEAASGSEAMAAVERLGPVIDVLVTDIVMPRMHGDELALAVRQRVPRVEVLLISGYPDALERSRQTETGDWAYLGKPFRMETFLEVVNDLVSRSR